MLCLAIGLGVIDLNIVYVYNKKWPSKRPGINFVTFTCNGLAKADEDVNVYLFASKSQDEKYCNKDYKEVLREYFSIEPKSNFKVYPLEYKKIIGSKTIFYWTAFKKILKIIRTKKIDVIITRNTNFLPYLYLLCKIMDAKVFFETHHFYLDQKLREKNDRKKETFWQKMILPRINGIICLQNEQKKFYEKYISEQNYCVARNGVQKVYENHNSWDNKYIGYVGSLDDLKGVKEIIYCFKSMENRDLKLLIVGGRNEKLKLEYENLIKKLRITNRVKITGWVKRKKLEQYLQQMKIGIVPAEDNFYNRYITSPMKIFDYFSYGIPVIGSDLPTIRDIVTDDGGIFYKKGDSDKLTYAIETLCSSQELYNKYSSYLRERAKKFLWKKRGEKLINFFRRVN